MTAFCLASARSFKLASSSSNPRLTLRLMSTGLKEDKVSLKSGHNIKFVQSGEGNKTVLLLPGALGTAKTDFSPQLQGLNKSGLLKIIAWDPPGYGDSRPPNRTWPKTPNFFHRDADVAVEFMKELGHDRFSVVGWSDGAITGLVIAGKYPTVVTKLVSHAGNSYASKLDFELLEKIWDVSKWSSKMREPMEKVYGKDYFPVLWKEWVDAYNSLKEADGDICSSLLPNIVCPTLIIQGEKDAVVSPEHPEYLENNIKNSRVERYPDGKHNLHLKYQRDFNELVEGFLLE